MHKKNLSLTGFIVALACSVHLFATIPTQKEASVNKRRVEALLKQNLISQPQCISVPEGWFIYSFNPDVNGWLQKPLVIESIQSIREALKPNLKIPLTKEGFTPASTRRAEDEHDSTGYNAIWVRDCCWQYYALKIQDTKEARRLVMSLLGFYSTDDQISRFLHVIKNPEIADPSHNPNAAMDVPLIRFSSKTLTHYLVDGKPQPWNHLQFDSHGLFLLMLSDALSSGIISSEDLTPKYLEAITLFPAFFTQMRYWDKKDAGPWEEDLMFNASSAGIVAAGLKRFKSVIDQNKVLKKEIEKTLNSLLSIGVKYKDLDLVKKIQTAFTSQHILELYGKGVERVEKDLSLGGEAPDVNGKGIDRGADAALLFLCVPYNALFSDNPKKIKQILNIDLSLIGPFGMSRYKYDAYQAANFWIDYDISSDIIGHKTETLLFATRLKKGFLPAKDPFDAQWFFDSIVALAYYTLAKEESKHEDRLYYLRKGDVHLKRSLGQLTGPNNFAADGAKLGPWQLAESVNTVIDTERKPLPMHSPICPLGWATAALQMALEGAERAHLYVESEAKVFAYSSTD